MNKKVLFFKVSSLSRYQIQVFGVNPAEKCIAEVCTRYLLGAD